MSGLRRRLGVGPRSLRVKLLSIGLLLALLPLLLLAIAGTYEDMLVAQDLRRLKAAAAQAHTTAPAGLAALGRRMRAEIALLDAGGQVTARSHTMIGALERSAVGALGERLMGNAPAESLEEADRGGGPWAERTEVKAALAGTAASRTRASPSTETLVIALAEPSAGGALYLLTGSHRGVRRLLFLRRELAQLVVYELLLALPLLLLFAFRIVRPIERLADAVHRYPAATLADPALLARNDEIATLARILADMAADIERRRQQAADLGADLSHEFKNPLASIAASAELLQTSKALTPERVALVSSTIGQSVERLRRSLDDLMALLRLEQAVPAEAREPVAYAALIDEVLGEYRSDGRYADWRFTRTVEDDARPALNRARWAELLRNLIDNALVQPALQKEIIVTVERTPGGLVTAVRDHGPGISPENQRRIFQRFFTARPPGAPPGTGLGLSVVETIARAHGGRVEVQSQPGQGATFVVYLPVL
jgi:two-component system sensor histidine kinase ChvG